MDFSWEGFSWISNDDYTQSVIAFRRIDKSGNELIIVCNFVPVERKEYRIGTPIPGTYEEVFSSDRAEYGGSGITNGDTIKSTAVPMHGCEESIALDLPPMSVLYLRCRRKKPRRRKAVTEENAGETAAETRPARKEDPEGREGLRKGRRKARAQKEEVRVTQHTAEP